MNDGNIVSKRALDNYIRVLTDDEGRLLRGDPRNSPCLRQFTGKGSKRGFGIWRWNAKFRNTGAYNAKSYAFIYKLISVDDKF